MSQVQLKPKFSPGQSLPEDILVGISRKVRAFDTVSELYDIKTEILGTDTVRYKAEIRFNPEGLSRRKTKLIKNLPNTAASFVELYNLHNAQSSPSDASDSPSDSEPIGEKKRSLSAQEADLLHESFVENDAQFYLTMTQELKNVEAAIKEVLRREFKHVHVDLEPM